VAFVLGNPGKGRCGNKRIAFQSSLRIVPATHATLRVIEWKALPLGSDTAKLYFELSGTATPLNGQPTSHILNSNFVLRKVNGEWLINEDEF
jgi:hypothetical protein